ncbi:MAG: queuosine precursor transporter [Chlamydiota bacterium]
MNELLFFFHIFIIVCLLLISFRMGKLFLICTIAFQGVLANLFVIQQIELFHYTVTSSDVFSVGSLLGLYLVQEYFGEKASHEAIFLTFFLLLFFLIMSYIHVGYVPSILDNTQSSFLTIFSSAPRIILASMISFCLMQKFSLFFYKLLKKNTSFQGKMFITLIGSQLFDTFLFTFLGLYGIIASIGNVLFLSSLVKILTIAASQLSLFLIKKSLSPGVHENLPI